MTETEQPTPGWMLELAMLRATLAAGAQLYVVSEGVLTNDFALQLPDIQGRKYFIVHPDRLEKFLDICRAERITLVEGRHFWNLETDEQRYLAAQRFAYWSQFDQPGETPEEVNGGK